MGVAFDCLLLCHEFKVDRCRTSQSKLFFGLSPVVCQISLRERNENRVLLITLKLMDRPLSSAISRHVLKIRFERIGFELEPRIVKDV